MLKLSPSREAVGGSENSANVCVLFLYYYSLVILVDEGTSLRVDG